MKIYDMIQIVSTVGFKKLLQEKTITPTNYVGGWVSLSRERDKAQYGEGKMEPIKKWNYQT